eukprot:PhF_6_TR15667/c0_g1_i2/m.24350/K09935/K09935; uncharacterized protein
MYYLSKCQEPILRSNSVSPELQSYAEQLPCWIPHEVIASGLGYGPQAVEVTKKVFGETYHWAPEFENCHSFWRGFEEPGFEFQGTHWKGSEQLFQAQKLGTVDSKEFAEGCSAFAQAKPMEAFGLGQGVKLASHSDWERRKVDAMRLAVRMKFTSSEELKRLLLSTHPHPL